MTHHDTPQPPEPDGATTLSRRRFLQGGLAAAAAATAASSIALPLGSSEATTAQPNPREVPPAPKRGKGPNILIILCDEMRFPPSYESDLTRQFREVHLEFQNALLADGLNFQHHYIMSAACVPSRASILTGHYPSLHGTSQTFAAAKEACDPDIFWVDPNSVPTFGNYFRAAGYLTFWIGKWHVSYADMLVPGTHEPLVSFDPDTGARDPVKEKLYKAANRLDPFGFAGWIGPESHGSDPIKDTGSSVPSVKPGQPIDYRGRDVSFAEQATELIQELDQHPNSAPWLVVCSFVNPHDIACDGMFTQPNQYVDTGFEFKIDESLDPPVPALADLFTPSFEESMSENLNDPLKKKPKAQASYRDTYHVWLNPVLDDEQYCRYYYQLHKNVDGEMMKVFTALQNSRYKDDTIVVFTSDHGEMLVAHGGMHQKMYQAYEETTRVPLMIWYPKRITGPRSVDALTSHADLAPTLLGLAGIDRDDREAIRQKLAVNHSDAVPFVGRDLSPLILGDGSDLDEPVYFMTDDDPSRGLHMYRKIGVGYRPVVEPNHVETVIARLDDGHLWKYSRYFDSPQYWSSPGTPGVDDPDTPGVDVKDVLQVQVQEDPAPPPPDVMPEWAPLGYEAIAKDRAESAEFEMYDLDDDPTELTNLYSYDPATALPQQAVLARLLAEQRTQKRLTPCSGVVPGQDCNPWEECAAVCSE
jgi:choline-sulfatase